MQIEIANHGDRIAAMPTTLVNGRNLRDGYLRGCGLQFGNARALCAADPSFSRAYNIARGRSLIIDDNLRNLFLLIRYFLPALPPGHIVEFGTARGGSALFMASLAQEFCPGTKVFGFDSFVGMPDTDPQRDVHKKGDFSEVSEVEIQQLAKDAGIYNLELVKGMFEHTIPSVLGTIGPIRLVHFDCDLYDAVCLSYDASRPHMVPGGYFVFDDPLFSSCLGAFEAVESLLVRRDGLHAEQVFPQLVYRQAT
jgi:hypothetical protein